jgi:hypothetical protein
LYYDWKLKANLNIISSQLGSQGTVWDLEWNNGTSFIFSHDQPVCKTLHFDVGILTPDWLKDSKYLGQTAADNFVTNVWTKAKFINYYADQVSSWLNRWLRWDGAQSVTYSSCGDQLSSFPGCRIRCCLSSVYRKPRVIPHYAAVLHACVPACLTCTCLTLACLPPCLPAVILSCHTGHCQASALDLLVEWG